MAAPAQAPAFSRLITLTYQANPPRPVDKVTDPTPDEEYERYVEEQKLKSQQAQEDAAKAKSEAGGQTSMMGKLTSFGKSAMTQLGDATNKAHGSVESTARNQLNARNLASFQENFPALSAEAKLHCAYSCKAMHNAQQIDGTLFVASTAVAFASKVGVREVIPLNEIASLQPSLALPTSKAMDGKEDGPPYILPRPHPNVVSDCLQLFTTGKQLFQFLKFDNILISATQQVTTSVKGSAFDRCYNWLDHAWRAFVQVPLNIDYY